jgi:hypothetical protein
MAATTESNPASGAAVEGAYVTETAWGTTPTTPDLQAFRFTSFNVSAGPEYFQSAEMNPLRVLKKVRQTYKGPSFQISGELIYGNLDELLEGVFTDEWSTDVLTEDNTFKSFTLEKSYTDAVTPFFEQLTGAVITDFQLNIDGTGNNAVTFTMSGIAKTYATATTSLDGDGYTAVNTNDPMVAAQTAVSVDDSLLTDRVTALQVSWSNSYAALRAVGSTGPAHIAPNGLRSASGQLTLYVTDKSWLDKMDNETGFDLDTVLADAPTGGNSYTIAQPTCSINGDVAPTDGADAARQTIPFVAVNASGSATTSITRAAAA